MGPHGELDIVHFLSRRINYVRIVLRVEEVLTEIHLLTAIAKTYTKMGKGERIRKIKKLVAKSEANEVFIRKYFPEYYEEAFPTSSGADASWESDQHPALSAKQR
jgi:hypothetical protein